MQFASPLSWLILPGGLFAYLLFLAMAERRRKRQLSQFADPHLLPLLLPQKADKGSHYSSQAQLLLATLFFIFIAAALARPQWGFTLRETTRRGIDLVIALDISESMQAQDVSPNRLERARREIFDLMERLQGDRVGFITFAGAAFVEAPLTLDYSALRMFVESADTKSAPLQGTNIELAIRKAAALLDSTSQKSRSRALLLITDGEELEGKLEEAKTLLKDHGVDLSILGIGTPEGGPIVRDGYEKRSREGQLIISRLNEKALEEFAASVGGRYLRATSTGADTEQIYTRGMKRNLKDEALTYDNAKIWHEYFQIPLLLGILCLIFGNLHEARLSRFRLLSRFFLCLLFSLFVLSKPSFAQQTMVEQQLQSGKAALDSGHFTEGLAIYEQLSKTAPENPHVHLGKGAAFYRMKEFEKAEEAFLEAARVSQDTEVQAHAFYNAGNSAVQTENYQTAIEYYQESLKRTPQDRELAENLEYTKKLLKQKREQEKQEKKEQQQEKQDKQQDQQKEQQQDQKQEEEQRQEEQQQNSEKQKQEQQNSSEQQKLQRDQQNQSQEEPSPTPVESPAESGDSSASPEPSPTPNQSSENKSEGDPQVSPEPSPTPASQNQEDNKPKREASDSREALPSQEGSEKKETSPTEQVSSDEKALELLLGSIEEKPHLNREYRIQEALEQLRKNGMKRPQKDW